ncbi:sel1 repeat family protein [Pelomyxa schiedti]|nr:sel1 repeat family protein [Pelomyxa schiedti]
MHHTDRATRVVCCWVCNRPINISSVDDSNGFHTRMDCGHNVCGICMVSLCTSAYLSLSSQSPPLSPPPSPKPTLASSIGPAATTNKNPIISSDKEVDGTKEEEEHGGEVDIECRVCHRVTTLSVWDVMSDHGHPDDLHLHSTDDALASLPWKCGLHTDRPLERFCVTCKLLVCSECALDDHSTHELVTITRQAQTAKEQVPGILDFINEEGAFMEESTQKIECAIRTLTKRQRRVEGHIKGTFHRLKMELKKRKNTLLANTSKFFEARKRALKLQMKCVQSVVSHLKESQTQLKTAADNPHNSLMQTSLVAITCSPVLISHSSGSTYVGACHVNVEGRFHIKQEDFTGACRCIKNLPISVVGDDVQFALQTMRLFVEGKFKQAFELCLEMLPCSSLCAIRAPNNNADRHEYHVHSSCTINTCNQPEAVALMLMYLVTSFKPSLFHRLGPFTRPPGRYIRCILLPQCAPESQGFLRTLIEAAFLLVVPSTPTIRQKARRKLLSMFQSPTPATFEPVTTSSPVITDWRCGVAALAHVMCGFMHFCGAGVRVDLTKAEREYNYTISSCLGNMEPTSSCLSVPRALAEYFIGSLLYDSPGGTSKTEAIEHWNVSAHLGNVWAQADLGCCNLEGDGCKKNTRDAVKWLSMASEGGDSQGQYRTATLYETGCDEAGVKKDLTEAMRLYRLAAQQGNCAAQYQLGVLLVDGRSTNLVDSQQQLHEEGISWLLLSSDQGNKKAKTLVCQLYNKEKPTHF